MRKPAGLWRALEKSSPTIARARGVAQQAQDRLRRPLPDTQVGLLTVLDETLSMWLFEKGVTAPIVGTTKVEHLEEAVGALSVKLTDNEIKYLEEPLGRSQFYTYASSLGKSCQ